MASLDAPRLRVREVELRVRPARMRIPFHFGDTTLKACPQVFARVRVELGGGTSDWGMAAELMVPRWFDKRAERTLADNVADLQASLEAAAVAYLGHGRPDVPFGYFEAHYDALSWLHQSAGRTALSAAFGQAVMDRAVIDGCCRALGSSFFGFARVNGFGLRPSAIAADLKEHSWNPWLARKQPRTSLQVRHTVGLEDELQRRRLGDDGLPASLPSAIERYGLRLFKIKIAGDVQQDLARVQEVVSVVERLAPDYQCTLDGNEQYTNMEDLGALVEGLTRLRITPRVLYIEQPLAREQSLDAPLPPSPVPYLMDEADDALSSFVQGQRVGWSGVSAKGCKGIYKSILNAARCTQAGAAVGRLFLSAEDLSCQAGVAVQQDLAIAAFLGLEHAERNGHHFGRGFADLPAGERDSLVRQHPDLYAPNEPLRIEQGRVQLGSLHCAGFAHAAEISFDAMSPLADALQMLPECRGVPG